MEIGLHCFLGILLVHQAKLHCACFGNCVVDIVERHPEDVSLCIPPQCLIVRVIAVVNTWLVGIRDTVPGSITLLRDCVWVLVDPVLELIDDCDVADHRDSLLPAVATELRSISLIEKLIDISHAKILHTHRMDFAGI